MDYVINNLDKNRVHIIIVAVAMPNDVSVALHKKFGFEKVSYFRQVGCKFNQWCDVAHWQLTL